MITVPEATKKIVERSRFLSEAISKKLINYSSLARYIRPELEEMLIRKVSQGSIIMALKRLENDFAPKYQPQTIFKSVPEMTIRSGLHLINLPNREMTGLSMLLLRESTSRSFYLRNQGIYETSLILSEDLFSKFRVTIEEKKPTVNLINISALTITIPLAAIDAPGIYYFFLKSLAWEGINVLEIVSTGQELTLILEDKNVELAFRIIKSIFV